MTITRKSKKERLARLTLDASSARLCYADEPCRNDVQESDAVRLLSIMRDTNTRIVAIDYAPIVLRDASLLDKMIMPHTTVGASGIEIYKPNKKPQKIINARGLRGEKPENRLAVEVINLQLQIKAIEAKIREKEGNL